MDASQNQYERTRPKYVDGNTVHKLSAVPNIRREEQSYDESAQYRHKRRQPKALVGMDFVSMLVLVGAIVTTVYMCISYLQMQTDVRAKEKQVVSLENELDLLTRQNDAAYDSIDSTLDLEYIYDVAVNEFGMVYPNNEQVIKYQASDTDYVRQYEDIPK